MIRQLTYSKLESMKGRLGLQITMAGLIILVWGTLDAEGQVGQRKKITGEKSQPQAQAKSQPGVSVGNLHVTQSHSRTWKTLPIDSLKNQLPAGESIYVIGNFTDTKDRLKTENAQLGAGTRILEESTNAIIIHTNRQNAQKLTEFQREEWIGIVEPLTAERKLTAPLQSYLAKVSPKAQPKGEPQPSKRPEPKQLQIVPDGQRPNLADDDDDGPRPENPDQLVDVTFYLFKSQDESDVQQRLTQAGGSMVSAGKDATISVVRAKVPASKVESVADSTAVREVTLNPKFVKHNDV